MPLPQDTMFIQAVNIHNVQNIAIKEQLSFFALTETFF